MLLGAMLVPERSALVGRAAEGTPSRPARLRAVNITSEHAFC